MGKRRGLSLEDIVKGGANNPAYDTLKKKIAAAAGYLLHGDGARRKTEAAELKAVRDELLGLIAKLEGSQVKELAEARALLEFALTKVDAGFARLSEEG